MQIELRRKCGLTICADVTSTAAFDASMLLSLQGAGESLGDERAFEICRGIGWRFAGSDGEHVDKLEDEEARKSSAEVADAVREDVSR